MKLCSSHPLLDQPLVLQVSAIPLVPDITMAHRPDGHQHLTPLSSGRPTTLSTRPQTSNTLPNAAQELQVRPMFLSPFQQPGTRQTLRRHHVPRGRSKR